MQLVVNCSVEPFFIALFDEKGIVVTKELSNDKSMGNEIFDFLEAQKEAFEDLEWGGGVCGPGGFSTLRTVSSLLKTLAFRYQVPIKQIEAFEWIHPWAKEKGYQHSILNSFGDKVFFDGEIMTLEESLNHENTWYMSLPESKREGKEGQSYPTPESLLEVLKKQPNQGIFTPSYHFDAVDA